MLGFDGEYSTGHPKIKFWRFPVKNPKISTAKHFIEKPILLNFVNLSTALCPRLYIIDFRRDPIYTPDLIWRAENSRKISIFSLLHEVNPFACMKRLLIEFWSMMHHSNIHVSVDSGSSCWNTFRCFEFMTWKQELCFTIRL